MPTSSTFSTDNQYIKYNITVTESNVNASTNTSTANVSVKVWRTNTGYTTSGTGTVTCTINGTRYTSSITNSQKITSSGIVLFSKSVSIKHNTDGSKTIYVSASISHSRFSSSTNGFNVTLTKINTAPSAPSSFTITAANGNYVSLGDEITLTASGASGNITGYNIQRNIGGSGWVDVYESYASTATSLTVTSTITDVSVLSGSEVKFRIRALNGSYASAYVESNTLIVAGGMNIKADNVWKTGSVWIKVDGVWKRAKKVWIKKDNVWTSSK